MDMRNIGILLTRSGQNAAWLAELCGVKEDTVHDWFSGRVTPRPIGIQLRLLMNECPPVLEFTLEEYLAMKANAAEIGASVEEFISRRLKDILPGFRDSLVRTGAHSHYGNPSNIIWPVCSTN